MMFALQAFGVVVGGFFAAAFVKGFCEAMVDDHRKRKKLIEKLKNSEPYVFPTKPPKLKVVWPDNDAPPRRKRATRKKKG
jgi:hypothetical protein